MMKGSQFFLAVVVTFFILGGCASTPPDTTMPQLTFAQMQPIMLNVSRIEFQNDYRPSMQASSIEHIFSPSVAATTQDMVAKQLVAGGPENVLRVILEEASVISEELPRTSGFWGHFTREPSERYKAKVALRFELVDPMAPDIVIGHAEVIAKQNRTVFQDMSPVERDRAYLTMLEELMDNVNDGFQTVVKNTFGGA